jgi:hypothetical protein
MNEGVAMAAVSKPRPGRAWVKSDRRVETEPVPGPRSARTPNPSGDEQAQLARDLAALIEAGLIVAVDDGREIRYAAVRGEEGLP